MITACLFLGTVAKFRWWACWKYKALSRISMPWIILALLHDSFPVSCVWLCFARRLCVVSCTKSSPNWSVLRMTRRRGTEKRRMQARRPLHLRVVSPWIPAQLPPVTWVTYSVHAVYDHYCNEEDAVQSAVLVFSVDRLGVVSKCSGVWGLNWLFIRASDHKLVLFNQFPQCKFSLFFLSLCDAIVQATAEVAAPIARQSRASRTESSGSRKGSSKRKTKRDSTSDSDAQSVKSSSSRVGGKRRRRRITALDSSDEDSGEDYVP